MAGTRKVFHAETLDTDALLNCANDEERRRLSVRPTGALAAASDIMRR
jgi:hypothetical protein